MKDHIGLQLWSLREEFKQNPETALDLVKAWGFVEVETAGTYQWTPEQFRAELDERGLKAVAAHVQFGALKDDPAKLVAEMKVLGVKSAYCPWIPHEAAYDAKENALAIEVFNRAGALFREAGIDFGYHIHGFEFGPGSKPGNTLFDDLVQQTKPEYVTFEMDVFWLTNGGADPMNLFEKYPNRWRGVHIKDMSHDAVIGKASSKTNGLPVGKGRFDWKLLLSRAQELGVRDYIIEDETAEPLKNIPLSLDYLRSLELK